MHFVQIVTVFALGALLTAPSHIMRIMCFARGVCSFVGGITSFVYTKYICRDSKGMFHHANNKDTSLCIGHVLRRYYLQLSRRESCTDACRKRLLLFAWRWYSRAIDIPFMEISFHFRYRNRWNGTHWMDSSPLYSVGVKARHGVWEWELKHQRFSLIILYYVRNFRSIHVTYTFIYNGLILILEYIFIFTHLWLNIQW